MKIIHIPSFLTVGLCLSGSFADAEVPKPSFLVVLTDDQPLRAMSREDPWFHTPNMDRLADEGIIFSNAFVDSSVCCVSRASIITGQHNLKHGIASFDTPLTATQMQLTFPGMLRKEGYRTAFLGKYGIGNTRAYPEELCLPVDQFDLWYGFQQSPSYSQMHNGEKRYLTSVMEEQAIEFLKETPAGQPFLVYLCLPEPHGQGGPGSPWNYRDPTFDVPPPDGLPKEPRTMTQAAYAALPEAIKNSRNAPAMGDYRERYPQYMATVRAYTARADLALGRMREALEELGRTEDTIVIFLSDNGSMWGAHGIAGKWNMYEESIRVPMVIYDPRIPDSSRGCRKQMVLNYDIAPTIMEMAGIPADHMQGQSLVPFLENPEASGRSQWFYHHVVHSRSTGKPLPACEGIRTKKFKYIRYIGTDPLQEELFDLQTDPLEQHNLASDPDHGQILLSLRAACASEKAGLE